MIELIGNVLYWAAVGVGGLIVALLGAYAFGMVLAMVVCGYKKTLMRGLNGRPDLY